MKGTVKEIKGVKEWEGQHGILFFHALVLEDGTKLNIGKKKKDAFTEGQQIEYEPTGEPDQNGWQRAKHITSQKRGGYQPEPFEHKAITMSMGYAKDLVIAGKVDLAKLSQYADLIYEWMISKK